MEDLRMSLLSFNFVMVYIIHKMLVLLENQLNFLKYSIFECFLQQYNRLLFFYSQHLVIASLKLQEENIYKDIRNIFRPKKEHCC